MTSQRLRVQNALVDAVKDFDFAVVTYDGDGNPSIKQQQVDTGPGGGPQLEFEDVTTKPHKPIIANEINATFEPDIDYGRDDAQRVGQWQFALRLSFDQEVVLDAFERSVNEDLITIPKSGSLEPVQLRLTSKEVEHPVQQQEANGTKVEFIFEALEGRN